MNFFVRFKHAIGFFVYYYIKPNPKQLGFFGKGAALGRPANLKNPQNIYLYEHARIGPNSIIMTMGNSKFVMKRESGAAEGLTVVTSNHKQKKGQFRSGGNEDNLYRDIIVEEDVWIGIHVTLLSGAHIGRGAIIGAGAVIRKSIPPYAVVIGNPARIVKFKWSIEEILEHEKKLYNESERLSIEQLEQDRENFEKNRQKYY